MEYLLIDLVASLQRLLCMQPLYPSTTTRLDEGTDSSFVCERVCTSDRLLRRMGDLSKVRRCMLSVHRGGAVHHIAHPLSCAGSHP